MIWKYKNKADLSEHFLDELIKNVTWPHQAILPEAAALPLPEFWAPNLNLKQGNPAFVLSHLFMSLNKILFEQRFPGVKELSTHSLSLSFSETMRKAHNSKTPWVPYSMASPLPQDLEQVNLSSGVPMYQPKKKKKMRE